MTASDSIEQLASPGWDRRVEALVESLRGAYERLDALGLEQAETVTRERVDELLSVLAKRQPIVDDIEKLAGELTPYVRVWGELSGRLPEGVRGRLGEQMDAIESLRTRIAERDAAHQQQLSGERDAVADRIASVGNARAAVSAYGGGPRPSTPRFQDREG